MLAWQPQTTNWLTSRGSCTLGFLSFLWNWTFSFLGGFIVLHSGLLVFFYMACIRSLLFPLFSSQTWFMNFDLICKVLHLDNRTSFWGSPLKSMKTRTHATLDILPSVFPQTLVGFLDVFKLLYISCATPHRSSFSQPARTSCRWRLTTVRTCARLRPKARRSCFVAFFFFFIVHARYSAH